MLKDLKIIDIDKRGKVTYSFDSNNPLITGQKRLIQQIVKLIFTNRGSNVYRPTEGSSFLQLMQAVDESEVDNIKSSLPLVLKSVKDQIITSQNNLTLNGINLSDEEKLLNLELENIEFDPIFGGWIIKIRVITQANETSIII